MSASSSRWSSRWARSASTRRRSRWSPVRSRLASASACSRSYRISSPASFREQNEAGDEIRYDRMQAEADANRERTGDQRDLLRVDADLAQRDDHRDDEADIADDRHDRHP